MPKYSQMPLTHVVKQDDKHQQIMGTFLTEKDALEFANTLSETWPGIRFTVWELDQPLTTGGGETFKIGFKSA